MTPTSVIASDQSLNRQGTTPIVQPLRIAMLSIHSSPLGELGTGDTGGMSVYVRELSRELGRAGHSIDIYTCADSARGDPGLLLSDNVRLVHLGIGDSRPVTKGTLFGHLPEVFRRIEAYMAENRLCYDLIHSHYWLSGWVGRIAQDRWYTPHVTMFHTTGMAKRIACGREREPLLRLLVEKQLTRTSDRVLTATERERDFLMRCYDVPGEKIGMVPCGVDLERFRPTPRELARRELGIEGAQTVVLYVGRFAPVKGLDRLIAAAAHLRHYRGIAFVIVGGDGRRTRESAELGRLVRKASVDGIVKFHGRVEQDLLPLYYSAADLLVVPSYYESFGLVALESLACGTPVIATRVGAMDRLIQDGRTGLILDTPSPRSLAAAIERFVLASPREGVSREEIRATVLGHGWSSAASAIAGAYAAALQPAFR